MANIFSASASTIIAGRLFRNGLTAAAKMDVRFWGTILFLLYIQKKFESLNWFAGFRQSKNNKWYY